MTPKTYITDWSVRRTKSQNNRGTWWLSKIRWKVKGRGLVEARKFRTLYRPGFIGKVRVFTTENWQANSSQKRQTWNTRLVIGLRGRRLTPDLQPTVKIQKVQRHKFISGALINLLREWPAAPTTRRRPRVQECRSALTLFISLSTRFLFRHTCSGLRPPGLEPRRQLFHQLIVATVLRHTFVPGRCPASSFNESPPDCAVTVLLWSFFQCFVTDIIQCGCCNELGDECGFRIVSWVARATL